MHKKILVAFDGSLFSTNTLHYLGHLFTGQRSIHFDLLCLVRCDIEIINRDWIGPEEFMEMVGPEARNLFGFMGKKLADAARQLSRYGIDPQQISTRVKFLKTNRAADIIHEARCGLYDAVIIGRRGLTPLEELVIGSVSSVVLEKCHDVPVWLIDGKVNSRKFLLPVDGSDTCLKGVDHLAFMLKDNQFAEVTLFRSTALFSSSSQFAENNAADGNGENQGRAGRNPDDYFKVPEQILIDSGFPPKRIHHLETGKGIHPSRQIVRQALIDDFGTIVMGRRHGDIGTGFGHILGLFGSTSEKVVGMAENTAIWLVG